MTAPAGADSRFDAPEIQPGETSAPTPSWLLVEDPTEPGYSSYWNSVGAWWKFSPSMSGTMQIDKDLTWLDGHQYSEVTSVVTLFIYDANFTQLYGADAPVAMKVEAGATYYAQITSWGPNHTTSDVINTTYYTRYNLILRLSEIYPYSPWPSWTAHDPQFLAGRGNGPDGYTECFDVRLVTWGTDRALVTWTEDYNGAWTLQGRVARPDSMGPKQQLYAMGTANIGSDYSTTVWNDYDNQWLVPLGPNQALSLSPLYDDQANPSFYHLLILLTVNDDDTITVTDVVNETYDFATYPNDDNPILCPAGTGAAFLLEGDWANGNRRARIVSSTGSKITFGPPSVPPVVPVTLTDKEQWQVTGGTAWANGSIGCWFSSGFYSTSQSPGSAAPLPMAVPFHIGAGNVITWGTPIYDLKFGSRGPWSGAPHLNLGLPDYSPASIVTVPGQPNQLIATTNNAGFSSYTLAQIDVTASTIRVGAETECIVSDADYGYLSHDYVGKQLLACRVSNRAPGNGNPDAGPWPTLILNPFGSHPLHSVMPSDGPYVDLQTPSFSWGSMLVAGGHTGWFVMMNAWMYQNGSDKDVAVVFVPASNAAIDGNIYDTNRRFGST